MKKILISLAVGFFGCQAVPAAAQMLWSHTVSVTALRTGDDSFSVCPSGHSTVEVPGRITCRPATGLIATPPDAVTAQELLERSVQDAEGRKPKLVGISTLDQIYVRSKPHHILHYRFD